MSEVIHRTNYHLAFNVKYRKRVLIGDIAAKAKEIIENIASKSGCKIQEIKIMPDHVHLLISIPPQVKISDVVKKLKGGSSRYLFQEFPQLKTELRKGHLWGASYFVRTTGNVTMGTVKKYIKEQKENERK